MKTVFLSLMFVFASAAVHAAPVEKYAGKFEFIPGGIHKTKVVGDWSLTVDGETLTQVYMKPTEKVVGKTEFTSTEQTAYSKAGEKSATMAAIFKLQGPTHQWYYVYVGQTTDAGKTYAGDFYKAPGPVDAIKKILDSGNLASWKAIGTGDLAEK